MIQELQGLGSAVDNLNEQYALVTETMEKSGKETAHVLEMASHLKRKRQLVLEKKESVQAFLSKFTLNQEEIAILNGPESVLDGPFFEALARLQSILRECTVLLSMENQTAGLCI